MNYYIQGNKEKADQIKAAFEAKGYDISWPGGLAEPNVINIGVERNGAKYVVAETAEYIRDLIKTHPDCKELKLPVEPHYDISNFYAGMPVLVRIDNSLNWSYALFSHYNKGWAYPFSVACCCSVKQCIPYNNDTKHLLGTTDPCDEQYINW